MRIGQGFDLHRLEAGIPFVLGGVPITWDKGPKGHSDGDVVLHALVDALLGATGKGDIGEWFPPSDAQWKGADSKMMLGHVWSTLQNEGWQIENVDINIILEAPKLAPYKPQIRECIANLLSLPADRISVKAKTMEQLGPIGQGEAVAALVSLLLSH